MASSCCLCLKALPAETTADHRRRRRNGSTKVDGPSMNSAQGAKNTLGNDFKTQKTKKAPDSTMTRWLC